VLLLLALKTKLLNSLVGGGVGGVVVPKKKKDDDDDDGKEEEEEEEEEEEMEVLKAALKSLFRALGNAARRAIPFVSSDDDDAKIIDGKQIAADIRAEIKGEVERLKAKTGKVPGLAVVIVGERKDSQTYVRMKRKACDEVGIHSFHSELPETISEKELIDVVKGYNDNPDCHGILVQLPLPKHIDEEKVLGVISLEKDVDGFHPLNIGMLAMKGHEPLFMPCTPKGSIVLLERSGVELKGKNAVVVGRSNIVGMPASMMLNKKDCTVTVVHSRTKNPKEICRRADIVIAAAGSAKMIKGDWIKKGAAVIDVGTNSVEDKSKKSGYALVGDVDFNEAKKRASFITPVPGGVGPMTIAMLLQNCLDGGKRAIEGTK
jgi:5,10-methylene-tetrahydrofolate dehydrogenase/methenyl tetrahydrofolate cyclohydrolase